MAQQWIRDLFPNAQWNAQNRTIGLPGGVTLMEGQGFKINPQTNRAEVNGPQSLISPYLNAPKTQVDPARFGQYYGMGEQLYDGLRDAKLNSIQTDIGNKRTQLGLNYKDAMNTIKENEGKSLMGVSASVAGRGLGSSGVANYQRKQMQGEYANKYDMIGKDRDEQMAGLASSELAAQKELAAQLQNQSFLYAQGLMNRDLDTEQQARNNMVSYLQGLVNRDDSLDQQKWQRNVTEAGLTGDYNNRPTLQKALQDAQIKNYADDLNYRYAALDAENRNSLNDLAYKYYNTDKDYEAATNKPTRETPTQYYDATVASTDYYRSGDDYYDDIMRNRTALIQKIGANNYDKLLQRAEETRGENWEGRNNWRPGASSPIGELLNPNVPTSGKTGLSNDIVSTVNRVAAKYDVDPALILAIGQHETGWGKLGDGRKGMYTGYGSYDNGSDYGYAGLEKQVEGTARKMKAWGMSRGNVSLERLRTGNSGKLPTGIYATDKNWPNAIWNYYQKYR